MTFLQLLPVVLSFLLLAAHFLHAQNLPLVGVSLLLPLLLFVRRRWSIRLIQIALLLGCVEWLATMFRLINEYEQDGRPWTRMVVILCSVMLFTAGSALIFGIPRLRRRYQFRIL